MKKVKINKVRTLGLLLVAILVITITVIRVSGVVIESGTHVFEDSELTYYVNVTYDGKDVEGTQSSDTKISEVQSGYIYVEDKIPEGLIFEGFVETDDGTIGAVERGTGESCQGQVIDGVDGLNYDEDTRKVSFTVKDLKAGCVLTVGIKTRTPVLAAGVNRMDFYNTAIAVEDTETVQSNTVHAWIGLEESEEETKYNVVYQYTGTVPDNATTLPSTKEYVEGSTVGIEGNANAVGYTFSGWTTNDVTVTNGSFTMPNKTVTFTGSFIEIPKYNVTYEIIGDMPFGYVKPDSKNYSEGMRITIDSLKEGDIINGYKFLGWKASDVTIDADNGFSMPASNVTITGSFEEVKYNVSYAFQGATLPSNAESLLPATVSYKPGEVVKLAEYPEVEGYRFLGWYKEDNFIMPEEDVVIYGEWAINPTLFTPDVTYEIENNKESYRPGETVRYKITVTNNETYPINDVVIQGHTTKMSFVEGEGYTLSSTRLAKIDTIPAKESVTVYEEYIVTESDNSTITSEIELIGALADGNYALDTEVDYKRNQTITIASKLNLCNMVTGSEGQKLFLFHITGLDYDSWAILEKNRCKEIYLSPGTYSIREVVPQDYALNSVTGDMTSNGGTLQVELGNNYEVTFNNNYEKKPFYQMHGRLENIIREVRGE